MDILFDTLTSLPVIIDNTVNGIAGMSEITDFAMLVNVDPVVMWIQKSYTDIYLWFGKQPPASIQQHLQQVFIQKVDKYGYWYKLKGQSPAVNLSACLEGIFSPVNDAVAEVVTEDILRKNISDTVKELLEAVKNASEIGGL
jgi:hypothetical protein